MECRAYGICLDSQSRGYLGKDRKVSSAAGGNLSRMHKTQETAKESRLNFMYSHLRNRTLGGTIERMRSAVAMVSGETSSIPAARARLTVAALRPSSNVSTRAPCSTRRTDIALPMAPGERIAITIFMDDTPVLPVTLP